MRFTCERAGQLAGHGCMEKRKHDFMMTDKLDAFGARSLDNIDARTVLSLFVEVDGDKAFEVVAKVVHHGNGLDKYLGHDDRAADELRFE